MQTKYYAIAALCLLMLAVCSIIISSRFQEASRPVPEKNNDADCLTSASAALALGDSAQAASIAAAEFENVKSSVKVRRQAAMVTSLCAYLNSDEQAADKCAAVAQRLAAAGIPASDKFKFIIEFLANPAISGKHLTDNIPAAETDAWAVASFAVFIRNVYSHSKQRELTNNLNDLQNKFSAVASDSWPYKAWAARIPLYREFISTGKTASGSIEPVFLH